MVDGHSRGLRISIAKRAKLPSRLCCPKRLLASMMVSLKTYNRPELITTPLKAGQQLLRAIPTEATPLTIDYAKH